MEPPSVFDSLVASTASPDVDSTPQDKVLLRMLVDQIARVPKGYGLIALVELLRAHGLAEKTESWVTSAPNVDVSGTELADALKDNSVLPATWIASAATSTGLGTPEKVFDHLAYILPAVIERLTPRGELPSEPVIQASLDSIRKQLSSAR